MPVRASPHQPGHPAPSFSDENLPVPLTTTGGVLAPTQIRPVNGAVHYQKRLSVNGKPPKGVTKQNGNHVSQCPPQRHPLRLVLLGSGGVGKSAMTIQFVEQYFICDYDPTISDSYAKQCFVDENMWKLEVLDTAGQDEFAAMREHNVRRGDGFLLVFSLTNRETFEYLKRLYRYIDRIKDRDFFPMIVVGNKCDLESQRQVSREEAESWAESVRLPYAECSAKNRQNVEHIFYDLVRLVRQFQIAERQNGLEYSDSANTSGSNSLHKKKKVCAIM